MITKMSEKEFPELEQEKMSQLMTSNRNKASLVTQC